MNYHEKTLLLTLQAQIAALEARVALIEMARPMRRRSPNQRALNDGEEVKESA